MADESAQGFPQIKGRLDEIVDAVGDESISLDDALALYEEAIKLGMQVSSLLEEDIAQEQIEATVAHLDDIANEVDGGSDEAAEAIDVSPGEEAVEGSSQEAPETHAPVECAPDESDDISAEADASSNSSEQDSESDTMMVDDAHE